MTGITRRLNRIVARDGRTLVLAYDHGIDGAHHAGMANPEVTLREAVAAGADAVLTTVGMARRFAAQLERVGLILNIDLGGNDAEMTVREAVQLGADMAKFIFFPWNPEKPDSIVQTKRVVMACHEYGLPLMIETIPIAFERKDAHTPENIAKAARIGCELGGDIIKMHYPDDQENFRSIVASLYRPVVILGGARVGELRPVLQNVRDALDAGAIGVTIGRYIWEHEQPGRVIAALAALIHEDATVDQAIRHVTTSSLR